MRKSTFSCGFLVHPVTINSNTSEQNVSRAENMNSQGTAKILQLVKTINSNTETHARQGKCWRSAQIRSPTRSFLRENAGFTQLLNSGDCTQNSDRECKGDISTFEKSERLIRRSNSRVPVMRRRWLIFDYTGSPNSRTPQ